MDIIVLYWYVYEWCGVIAVKEGGLDEICWFHKVHCTNILLIQYVYKQYKLKKQGDSVVYNSHILKFVAVENSNVIHVFKYILYNYCSPFQYLPRTNRSAPRALLTFVTSIRNYCSTSQTSFPDWSNLSVNRDVSKRMESNVSVLWQSLIQIIRSYTLSRSTLKLDIPVL